MSFFGNIKVLGYTSGFFGNPKIIGTNTISTLPPPPYLVVSNGTTLISTITGLGFTAGDTPPESGLFGIFGDGLIPATGNITITSSSSNLQFWNGTTWQSTPLTFPYTGSAVSTPITGKVRINPSATANTYNETLTISTTAGNVSSWVVNCSGVVAPAPPVAIGTIFDETQSNGTSYDGFNAAQWNVKGSPVLTFTTGNIQITTSAANYWPDGIIYKRWVTNLQNFKQGAVIQYPSLAGTGCAISMQTTDSTASTYTLLAGSGGKIWLFNNKTLVAQTSFGFFNINAGDSLMMEFEKINGTLKCNVQNLTIPLSPVMTLTYNYAFTYPFSSVMPLAQRLAVVPWNGTYNIKSFYLNTTDKKNIDALFITDSKGIGYFANTFANQFSEQLATANPTKFISNSGTADETVAIDVIAKLPELVLINAKKYFLYIGCNDLRYGLISSLQANLTTVKNTLEAIGATVYFIESTPESGAGSINSTTVNNVASLVFASPNILPAYALFETTPGSGTPNPTLYSPDTIHPNLAGQTVLKNLIQPYL